MKKLLLSSLIGLALSASASAQTVLRLTGSTAFRAATHNAIKNIMGPSVTYGFTGSTLGGAGQAIFTGTVGANPVIIKTSWSGAVGGVQTVAGSLNVNFLPNSTTQSGGAGTSGAATGTEAAIPDVGMADQYQSSTPFNAPPYVTLVYTTVGVVPFKWVASNGTPAGVTNITTQQAQSLWGAGEIPLAFFTGSSADHATKLFATGRDPDSGTRVITFAESGIGIFNGVLQYQPTVSGTNVASHIPWPQTTVNGIVFTQGNGGYNSGGTLAGVMRNTTTGIGGHYITYLGLSDANTATAPTGTGAGPARELTWNGVPYSLSNVKEGLYTFWGYEHLTYRSSLAGVQKNVADTLALQIINVDSPVLLSDMQVSRQNDGSSVGANY